MCLQFNILRQLEACRACKYIRTIYIKIFNKDLSMMWGECCTHYIHIFVNNEDSTGMRVRAIHSDISKSFDGDKKYVAVQQ